MILRFGNTLVPWNVLWSGEQRYEIRPCKYARGQLAMWSPSNPGTGRPLFAIPHAVRQRKAVVNQLCTVCGEGTPLGDRWWFGLGEFREDMFMTTEAPLHLRCAKTALAHCPHLRDKSEDLAPFPNGWSLAYAVLAGTVEADFNVKIAGRTVIGQVKFAWPERACAFKEARAS